MLGGGKGTPAISDTNSKNRPPESPVNVFLVKAAAFAIDSIFTPAIGLISLS